MSDERCPILVKRRPVAMLENNPEKRDWAHLQRCGRPISEDGLCANHARLKARTEPRFWSRLLDRIAR